MGYLLFSPFLLRAKGGREAIVGVGLAIRRRSAGQGLLRLARPADRLSLERDRHRSDHCTVHVSDAGASIGQKEDATALRTGPKVCITKATRSGRHLPRVAPMAPPASRRLLRSSRLDLNDAGRRTQTGENVVHRLAGKAGERYFDGVALVACALA